MRRRCNLLLNIFVSFSRHYLFLAHEPPSLLATVLDARAATQPVRQAAAIILDSA